MNRANLEHVIRAAASIADDPEIVVIGSQAILGQYPDAPTPLCVSQDVDVYPKNHPERADVVDGAIGELSAFHETFGYYAHGVGPETAIVPLGWDARLVRVAGPGTAGAVGWCLEPHDLVLSKIMAGRDKDVEYAGVAIKHRLVTSQILRERLRLVSRDAEQLTLAAGRLERLLSTISSD